MADVPDFLDLERHRDLSGFGFARDPNRVNTYHLLMREASAPQAILPTELEGLSLIAAHKNLIGANVELVQAEGREFRLRDAIKQIRSAFDYIVLDCPPALDLLTLNALVAADSVLIPLQCEYMALEGLTQLIGAIRLVQDHLNPALRIEGVLLTMYDARLNLSQQVADEARKFFAERVYRTVIPRNVRLSEAPSFGKPIVLYDPHSTGAESYRDLAREVLDHA